MFTVVVITIRKLSYGEPRYGNPKQRHLRIGEPEQADRRDRGIIIVFYSAWRRQQTTQMDLVYKVAVRLQPFWAERPGLWFAQATAQFHLTAFTRQRNKL